MSSLNETLERMKQLYTYGKEVNESNNVKTHSLEYHAIAADGKSYGIIRENSKYYIKTAPKAKEMVAEAYDYIGGFCNKGNYEYTSYNNALKNFELKMASINEACDANVNISTLDPFKKNQFLVEGTENMKNEIARQRQIMHNAAMLMNESSEIGADRKNDVVKYDGKQPEAETGKRGDEDLSATKANPEFKGTNTNGVDKKVAPFEENPKQVNEACDAAGCDSDSEDWGSVGLNKGEDPEKIGWEMENQETVNEGEDCCPKCGKCGAECTCEGLKENEEWGSEGVPSEPGVGEADTDHNNDPFTKTVNEEEDLNDTLESDPEDGDVEDDEVSDEDFDIEDDEIEDTENIDDFDVDDDEDEIDDLDFEDEEDDATESKDELRAKIDELQAEIDALNAQLESKDKPADEELPVEEPTDNEELPAEEPANEELPTEEPANEELPVEEPANEELPAEEPADEEDAFAELDENKRRYLNSTVESIARDILKEDELHVFGKHPGYQKKPMELPSTGQDKTEHGEDWNDESVYSEQPFGEKIGDGDPFNKAVDTITKNVLAKLMEGKKKVK